MSNGNDTNIPEQLRAPEGYYKPGDILVETAPSAAIRLALLGDSTYLYGQIPGAEPRYKAYQVATDESLSRYVTFAAEPVGTRRPLSAKDLIEGFLFDESEMGVLNDYFKSIWQAYDSEGNPIGYGWDRPTDFQKSIIALPAAMAAPETISGGVFIDEYLKASKLFFPVQSGQKYRSEFNRLITDDIIRVRNVSQNALEILEGSRSVVGLTRGMIKQKRISDVRAKLGDFATLFLQYRDSETNLWKISRAASEFYAAIKYAKLAEDRQKAAKIVKACAETVINFAIGEIPVIGSVYSGLAEAAELAKDIVNIVKPEEYDQYLRQMEALVDEYLRNVPFMPGLGEPDDAWFQANIGEPDRGVWSEEIHQAFWNARDFEEAEAKFQELDFDYSAIDRRNLQIIGLTPFIGQVAEKTHRSEGSPTSETWSLLQEVFDNVKLNGVTKKMPLSDVVKELVKTLMCQPNTLIVAYELAQEYYPSAQLIAVLNEYVDQSHWMLVPNENAISLWAAIFNLDSPEDFKMIAPHEEFIRLKEVVRHPLIVEFKQKLGEKLGEKEPLNAWQELENKSQSFLDTQYRMGAVGYPTPSPTDVAYEEVGGGAWGPAALLNLVLFSAIPSIVSEQHTVTSMPQPSELTPPSVDLGMTSASTDGRIKGSDGAALDVGTFFLAPFKELKKRFSGGGVGTPIPQKRTNKFTERLFQIPQMMLTASSSGSLFPAGGSTENLLGGLSEPAPAPQIVHRFERGSVQVHTQKIDAKTLGNAFVSFLQEQSRQ